MSEARYTRLEELKAEAAAALNLPINADNVVLLSALKLEHEVLLESLIAGRASRSAHLRKARSIRVTSKAKSAVRIT
jgi:hypothetical protein